MKKLIFFIPALLFLFFISSKNYAQTTPVVDAREQSQRTRIREGVASGQVTHHEALRLRGEQRRVRRTERRAKADGTVTGSERARIEHKQNRASRDIRRQKRDNQTRIKTE